MFALATVFVAAFLAVTALRHWRSGGSWRDLFSRASTTSGDFRPEKYTLPDRAPLGEGDVELLGRLNDEYARLTQAVVPAVVSIDTMGMRTEQLLDVWGRSQLRSYPTQGKGSGVIVSKEGHIVTNHHVIAGQQKIQVTLHGGKTYPATLVGEDSLLDIAVLRIQGEGDFQPLKFGDSSKVQVGQLVFAIGNPFGLGETVTQGIISAKERSLSDNQRDLFQTDAAINPGNSGGPLVNLRGEIIAINVAIFSQDRENPGFQGVGFSIPGNDVKQSMSDILEKGRPVYGHLGIMRMLDLDASLRTAIQYEGADGAVVIQTMPGSPAEAAGLQPWDVIQRYNDETVHSITQLRSLVQRSKAGQEVTLAVWRKGAALSLKATLGDSGAAPVTPANPPSQGRASDPEEILQKVGVEVRDMRVPERMSGYRGVVVTRLVDSGLASEQLQPGDIILAVNNAQIGSASEFFLHLAASASWKPTKLLLLRNGRTARVELPAVPAPDEGSRPARVDETPPVPGGR